VVPALSIEARSEGTNPFKGQPLGVIQICLFIRMDSYGWNRGRIRRRSCHSRRWTTHSSLGIFVAGTEAIELDRNGLLRFPLEGWHCTPITRQPDLYFLR
jgi:hypothetical protein